MASSVKPREAAGRQSRRPLVDRGAFRADVEGLRAVAVTLVVLYHADLAALPGGYVGVDVFYVISGFLITGLLVREAATTGTISLRGFWARRARRLLPVSSIVLLATAVATSLIYAGVDRPGVADDIRAASLYISNWRFAANAVDYLGANAALSPVLHYWSLSVEEQFYLCWPILLVALIRVAGRRWLPVVRGAIVLIGVGSLTASILLTRSDATTAYYALHTRAWELAAGAGLALVGATLARRVTPPIALAASTIGIAMIAYAAVVYTTATPFPGSAAIIPVGGATLVLAAGSAGDARGLARLLVTRPMTYVGRISYAWYLWHWPVLVLVRARAGSAASWQLDVGAIALSFLLAAVSSRLVEQPVRHSRWLQRRVAVTLAFGLSLTLATPLLASRILTVPPTPHLRPSVHPTPGPGLSIKPATATTPLTMSPTAAIQDRKWLPTAWRANVMKLIRHHRHVDEILLARSWFERSRVRDAAGGELRSATFDRMWAAATARMLAKLHTFATDVYLIADVPSAPVDVPRCLSTHPDNPAACNFPRKGGAYPDAQLLRVEAAPARAAGARFVDLTPYLCTATTCPGATSDGVIVYIDQSHLTRTFSASLGLVLERALLDATDAPPKG